MWRYHLVAAQYWVHQVSSACPTTPENDMGQSNSGTEMSIQYILQKSKLKLMIWRTSNGQAPSTPSLTIATKVMIKQSWHYMILGYKTAPIIRGWFRFRCTFWGQLTFVVSRYAWHDISILIWCCHHPAQLINLQVSFTSFLVNFILGLSASSLVTLQSRLMCHLCKPFPPRKPHIFLVVFCFQRSWPVLWSLGALHGFGWMHVYFQVGMIIGDTEQHNKEYMWLPWRKWLT